MAVYIVGQALTQTKLHREKLAPLISKKKHAKGIKNLLQNVFLKI